MCVCCSACAFLLAADEPPIDRSDLGVLRALDKEGFLNEVSAATAQDEDEDGEMDARCAPGKMTPLSAHRAASPLPVESPCGGGKGPMALDAARRCAIEARAAATAAAAAAEGTRLK